MYQLYSTPNFELGYIQHGKVSFHPEQPKQDVLITDYDIKVYDKRMWGTEPIFGCYPIKHYTTKAKNTLIIIRKILEIGYNNTISLKNFFSDTCKEVTPQGLINTKRFDLEMQTKKLEYLLANPELSLSLLKDAYLDFYLFVDLLTKVDFNTESINVNLSETIYKEAIENTKIFTLAKEFAKLKQK